MWFRGKIAVEVVKLTKPTLSLWVGHIPAVVTMNGKDMSEAEVTA